MVNGYVHFIISLALMFISSSPAVASDTPRRLPTVADSIALRTVGEGRGDASAPLADRAVIFSPDRNWFVVPTRYGNLVENHNVFELLVYSTAVVRSGGNDPTYRLEFISRNNVPGVAKITWANDSNSIEFIGKVDGEIAQVLRLDLASGSLRQLTNSSSDVIGYSFDSSGSQILYQATSTSESIWNAANRRSGIVVTTQNPVDLVQGLDSLFLRGSEEESRLFLQRDGRVTPVTLAGRRPARQFDNPSLSPNGRFAVTRTQVPPDEIPAAWSAFDGPQLGLSLRTGLRPSYTRSTFQQWELIDLEAGTSERLLQEPALLAGGRSSPLWIGDGRSVIVGAVATEHMEGEGLDAFVRRAWIEVDLTNRTYRAVPDACGQPERWDEEMSILECAAQNTRTRNSEAKVRFVRTQEGWSPIPVEVSEALEGPEVAVREDFETPPALVVMDRNSGTERLLFDFNPQLRNVELTRVEDITWVNVSGETERGLLYYPAQYVPSRVYPLVIQTHGYIPYRFSLDGTPSAAGFAAQALAARGMFVLQLDEMDYDIIVTSDSRADLESALATYRSAIDHLVGEGLVDRQNVGVIGWSHTNFYVQYALAHTDLFAAASVGEGESGGYLEYMLNTNSYVDPYSLYGGAPYGQYLRRWMETASSFNLANVDAPLRIVVHQQRLVVMPWEWFNGLMDLNMPVEMLLLENGNHYLERPSERWASSAGNVDWFDFWLNRHEDPDPAKTRQYARWRELRERRGRSSGPGDGAP